MRIILFILASLSFLSPKAQVPLPIGSFNYAIWQPFPNYILPGGGVQLNQKWYFSQYAGISAGTSFFNGGSVTFLSVPVTFQLNHPLNNNLIAFAGISAGPSVYSFSRSFMDPVRNQSYPGGSWSNGYGFGMNTSVQMGLMYTNDAKTFSISGSIGVERGSYPVYPSNRMNTKKQ
jgi:hypothetical protein